MKVKIILSALFVIAVVLGSIITLFRLSQPSSVAPTKTQAAAFLDRIPGTFNAVQTHLFFFPRDGQQWVGKRYVGTKNNAISPNKKFMKVWSGPVSASDSITRMVVYQLYDGWDDKPGKIIEWETWRRDIGDKLIGLRWGGTVANATPPYWEWSFMNSYQPLGVNVSQVKFNCQGNVSLPQQTMQWPSLEKGSNILSYQNKMNDILNTCQPTQNPNQVEYLAISYREDYDSPYSTKRKQKCNLYAGPVWGKGSANKICQDAPYAGRFDQRYAYFDKVGGWQYGCEPLIYVWGYPENGPTHKAFRNGELRWADFGRVSASGYKSYNDETFWQPICDSRWQNTGGWIYTGEYQLGTNLLYDAGDAISQPVDVGRFTPNPTPAPASTTGIFVDPTCGFNGEEWCARGTQCDSGWVGGPTVNTQCPSNTKLTNTGTYFTRWDGLHRFVGTTQCIPSPQCQ